jgi:hypothetical protein
MLEIRQNIESTYDTLQVNHEDYVKNVIEKSPVRGIMPTGHDCELIPTMYQPGILKDEVIEVVEDFISEHKNVVATKESVHISPKMALQTTELGHRMSTLQVGFVDSIPTKEEIKEKLCNGLLKPILESKNLGEDDYFIVYEAYMIKYEGEHGKYGSYREEREVYLLRIRCAFVIDGKQIGI